MEKELLEHLGGSKDIIRNIFKFFQGGIERLVNSPSFPHSIAAICVCPSWGSGEVMGDDFKKICWLYSLSYLLPRPPNERMGSGCSIAPPRLASPVIIDLAPYPKKLGY